MFLGLLEPRPDGSSRTGSISLMGPLAAGAAAWRAPTGAEPRGARGLPARSTRTLGPLWGAPLTEQALGRARGGGRGRGWGRAAQPTRHAAPTASFCCVCVAGSVDARVLAPERREAAERAPAGAFPAAVAGAVGPLRRPCLPDTASSGSGPLAQPVGPLPPRDGELREWLLGG